MALRYWDSRSRLMTKYKETTIEDVASSTPLAADRKIRPFSAHLPAPDFRLLCRKSALHAAHLFDCVQPIFYILHTRFSQLDWYIE